MWLPCIPLSRYSDQTMPHAPAIRPCRPDDLPAVEPLYLALYNGHHPSSEDETLAQRLSDFFLVAEVDAQIVGFVIAAVGPVDAIGREMARESFPDQPTYLEVQGLYVAPAFRNQGIGSRLMETVLARGIAHGLRHSMVYTANEDYARTARFYERFGYKIDHLFLKRSL
jgi:ribosomal protein S18 acetylase RimI-like enzyme